MSEHFSISNSFFEAKPGVLRIELDRPDKANALDATLVERLHERFDRAETDSQTRAVIICGSGKNFCGGFDFAGYEAATEGDLLLRFTRIEQFLQRVRQAPFLTIARVHGAAFGAGADIAASCDYRAGTEAAKFRFPGFRFGVALGTARLAAIAGEDAARDILLESRIVRAAEAVQCGLLTHLVNENELDRTVAGLAASAAAFDAPSLRAMLTNVRLPASNGDAELAALVRSVARRGIHARIGAFLAKREPN